MLHMALPGSGLDLKVSRPSEMSGDQEGGLTVLWLLQAPQDMSGEKIDV